MSRSVEGAARVGWLGWLAPRIWDTDSRILRRRWCCGYAGHVDVSKSVDEGISIVVSFLGDLGLYF